MPPGSFDIPYRFYIVLDLTSGLTALKNSIGGSGRCQVHVFLIGFGILQEI